MTDSGAFSTKVTGNLSDEQLETVHSYLREYNQTANHELWAKFDDPKYDSVALHVVAHNDAGALTGGLIATTSMSWLKVSIMAVHEDSRRQGVGTTMLEMAETEAIRRGCKYAFLDTMDYQSPDFYRRCGYGEMGSIPDWDSHGHAKLYFTKQLTTK